MKYDTVIAQPSIGSKRVLPDGRQAVCVSVEWHRMEYAVLRCQAGGWMTWREWGELDSVVDLALKFRRCGNPSCTCASIPEIG